ncbi:MAG: hypothetical protein HY738_15645, partial [Bacteroidia bacterium]|nr:hypothetical protein [Bacteroidia bacterium]
EYKKQKRKEKRKERTKTIIINIVVGIIASLMTAIILYFSPLNTKTKESNKSDLQNPVTKTTKVK